MKFSHIGQITDPHLMLQGRPVWSTLPHAAEWKPYGASRTASSRTFFLGIESELYMYKSYKASHDGHSSVPLAASVRHAAKHALAGLQRAGGGLSGGCKA